MNKSLLKRIIKALANAPTTAAQTLYSSLSDEEKSEAERIFKALNINIKEVLKW